MMSEKAKTISKAEKLEGEKDRVRGMITAQETAVRELTLSDNALIAGVDEVGRGCLAGPVLSCAVILRRDSFLLYVNDSKKLSQKKRESLAKELLDDTVAIGYGIVENRDIDAVNIVNATKISMQEAVRQLSPAPEGLLIDAVSLDLPIPMKAVPKADETFYAVAAASILAKVKRDSIMDEYDEHYPGYAFSKNKGYGTEEHRKAICELGLCPIHRLTFLKNQALET